MKETQIDWRKTVEAILEKANRPFVPISKSFIQLPRGSEKRSSVLSKFVTNGDLRGLKAYLLIAASASSPDTDNEWYTSLPLQTWARAFGCSETAGSVATAKTAATRIFSRLQERQLIEKSRCGRERKIKVKLLAQDGSGEEYQRPASRYIRLSHDFWKRRLDEDISLPALAMLLVVLGERTPCELPTEHMPEWYGWSADTAERGLHELQNKGLIRKEQHRKESPLSPTGIAIVNEYYICPPFDKKTLDSKLRAHKTRGEKRERTNRMGR